MFNQFKNGDYVLVTGKGLNDGKIYKNVSAKVIERDPYYKDYLVKFEDGTEDWITPKYLQKNYKRS